MGGIGGKACYNSVDGKGDGGFGGGGGGCKNGGGRCFSPLNVICTCIYAHLFFIIIYFNVILGGGGYAGGNANATNGDGGISYVDTVKTEFRFANADVGHNAGSGFVVIIPAIDGCDCDYQCIALDEKRSETACICPKTWRLSDNKKSCIRK